MLRRLIYTIVICIGATSGIQAQVADFGDAPDGEPTGYPSPFAAVGSFPSLRSSDGARTLDITRMTLGPEADLEEDAQTVNNDTDDGLRGLTLVLTSIPPSAHLEVEVSAGTGGVFFLNVLIDLNMDGQWPGWGAGGEYEWVVRNFPVTLSAGSSDTVVPPLFAFGNGNRMPDGAWMRIALTDSVINGSWDGSGEFAAGEIEDYVVRMPEKEGRMVSVITATCPAPPLSDPIIIEQGETVDFDALVNVIPGPDDVLYSFERLNGGVLIQDNNPGAAPGFNDAFQGELLNRAGPGHRPGFTAKASGVLPSTWRYRFWAEDPLTSVSDTHVIVGFPGVVEGTVEFVPRGWSMFESLVIGSSIGPEVNGGYGYDPDLDTHTLSNQGYDIWGTYDTFTYAYTRLEGDGEISARVTGIDSTSSWAKAGVMIRETLTSDSQHALMGVAGGNFTAFQHRKVTGGHSNSAHGYLGTAAPPYWVKLVREGDTFTAYYSRDGFNWIPQCNSNLDPDFTAANPATISMSSVVYVGLFYSANNPNHTSNAYFDNVKFISMDYVTAAHAVVIDDFSGTFDFSLVNVGDPMPNTDGTTVVGDPYQRLGGELDIRSTLFNANLNEGVIIQCQGCLQCQVDENASVSVDLIWDGNDGNWSNDNTSQGEGLSTSIVKPDKDYYSISLDFFENLSPVDMEVSLFSDDNDWTKWYITLPAVSEQHTVSLRPQDAIFGGTGANPSCITAFKVFLEPGENGMQSPIDLGFDRLDIWNYTWPPEWSIILEHMNIPPNAQNFIPLEIGGNKKGSIEGTHAPVVPDVDFREYWINKLYADLESGDGETVWQSLAADLDVHANVASVEEMDMLFPCGDGPVGFTVCASSSSFPSGEYVLLVTKFVGDIPLQHGGHIYQYSTVFDSDDQTWNNYIPNPPFSNDFFAYTDKWYELIYSPISGWYLQVRDVRLNYAVVSSNARVVIAGSEMAWFIPREELDSDTAKWRITSFVHTGDYGLGGGFWSADYYPLVEDPLIPIPEPDSVISIGQ